MKTESKKSGADDDSNLDDDYQEYREIVVDPKQSAIRIDKFLIDRLEQVSRNRIQNAIKAGSITVNGDLIKSNYKVRPNDQIKIIFPKRVYREDCLPQEIPLHIIYEDDDVLVVNKQAGLVVHPGHGNWDYTLVNGLLYYFQHSNLPVLEGNPQTRPGLVHRIDKNTTGLLVIAKNELAMSSLAKQFFDHSIERKYKCLVWGDLQNDEGTIEGHIGRHPRFRKKMMVFPEGDSGKHAITHYKLIRNYYYVSLVECQLETGRTHQIRVHMAYINHPLFNDDRYGGDKIVKGTVHQKYKQFVQNCFDIMPYQALHAESLGFVHPTTKEKMTFTADLPDNFKAILDKWERYLAYRK